VNRWLLSYFRLALALLLVGSAFCAEVIPQKPTRYFNDFAGVTSPAIREQLNAKLEQLEKTNSTQVVVAIFKDMQTESSIDDYTLRIAQNWGVGQKGKSNGAILFVFITNRKMFLQVGYGLEGAIPDITAKDITENRIKPHFKTGNYDAGMAAGVDAIIQAAAGEYKGTGRTVAQGAKVQKKNFGGIVLHRHSFADHHAHGAPARRPRLRRTRPQRLGRPDYLDRRLQLGRWRWFKLGRWRRRWWWKLFKRWRKFWRRRRGE
jgi:uncharacterized protein